MKASSILHNIKHFILRKESKTSSLNENVPELFLTDLDGLKEAAGYIIDYINDTVEVLQTRIDQITAIHDYIKYDDAMMKKYGASIGERFGKVNVHTMKADEITLHLNDVIEGKYDEYPSQSIGALVFYWDKEVYLTLSEIDGILAELEGYFQYFQEIDVDITESVVDKKPTVH